VEIIAIGLNLKTANVEELERCFISKEEMNSSLSKLKESAQLDEIVILSTCNRVEVYGMTNNIEKTASAVESFFVEKSKIQSKQLLGLFFKFAGRKTIEHLFKVTSGIDSLVIGESQILGQVKNAYEDALSRKYTGKILNRLFHDAITIGKRVRTETTLGGKQASVATMGVKLVTDTFSDLSDKIVLLIGAGEMAEEAASLLNDCHIRAMHIYNRNPSRADELAQKYNATTISNIKEGLVQADIVISSTSSLEFIISKEQILEVMNVRGNRQMFFIDIAIPRDIDPQVRSIEKVHIFNIDDLKNVAEDHKRQKEREIEIVTIMIKEGVASFLSWIHSLSIEPVIKDLTNRIETLCRNVIYKNYKSLIDKKSKEVAVHTLSRSLTKKILHHPITVLRRNVIKEDGRYLEATLRLFKLEECNFKK
jgi:glutamyl-tRNA reductase